MTIATFDVRFLFEGYLGHQIFSLDGKKGHIFFLMRIHG
jgi:hypothetical protein